MKDTELGRIYSLSQRPETAKWSHGDQPMVVYGGSKKKVRSSDLVGTHKRRKGQREVRRRDERTEGE